MKDINWCINYLKTYNNINKEITIPENELLRALMNITMPNNLSEEYYLRQDRALNEILATKKIVNIDNFPDGMSIYQGDITLIKSDVIVNACNNKMLGCFVPNHHCVDNAIHSFGGLQIRRDMMEIMNKQGFDEPNGQCKVTKAYNLPSKYVFHTVGPIYSGIKQDNIDLMNCYLSCLRKADEMGLQSIVFCSLSTGIYGFPINKACDIVVKTVKEYLEKENKNIKKVIFDVFSKDDYDIYNRRLKESN